jgi:hypothetical protein
MKNLLPTFAAFVLLFSVQISCQQKSPAGSDDSARIDYGTIVGKVYTNKTLGLKLKFPDTMIVDSRKELDEGLKEGVELIKAGDNKHDKSIDQMAQKEKIVFGLNTPDSEAAATMNISVIRGAGTGPFKDMVAVTLRVIVDSMKAKVVKPISDESLGGVGVFTFVTSMEIDGVQVHSKVYALRRNDHLISISISYGEDRGFQLMEKVLNGIEFF